ncbi:MAG TPA: hypothetical protein IAA88_06215 [Candidatus Avimuribaculum pullicola]|nr:hypothetical protein [Candidatus Avimuribaculum pullicola]
MNQLWLWIVISMVIGVISAFVFTSAVNRMTEVPEDATDNAAGISKLSNIALNVVVFSILSFLVAWLVMAVLQRGPYATM